MTKIEIAAQHFQCCDTLFAENINPFLMQKVIEDGQVKEKLRKRTVTHDVGPESYSYFLTRDWVSLPRADARRGRQHAGFRFRHVGDAAAWGIRPP